jgi:hypothetical protein
MAEPTIDTLLGVMRDELTRVRDKAIAINLVAIDLLKRGYYVYRQEMPDELYHLLAIKDDDTAIARIRVLTHPPVHGMDDLLPGEIVAVVLAGAITYTPNLPESNMLPTPLQEAELVAEHRHRAAPPTR